MPMKWTPEADQKLLAALLKTSDVAVNYAAVAQEMGSECTTKALIHRIATIKNSNTSDQASPTKATVAASTTVTALKTPRKRKTAAATETTGTGDDDNDGNTINEDAAHGKGSNKKKARAPSAKTKDAAATEKTPNDDAPGAGTVSD